MSQIIKGTEQCKFCMQIASLKLNFYHQTADSVGLHVITWKKRRFRLKQFFFEALSSYITAVRNMFKQTKIQMDNISVAYFILKKLCDFLK